MVRIKLYSLCLFFVFYACEIKKNSIEKKDCELVKIINDTTELFSCKDYYLNGNLKREGDFIGQVAVGLHSFYDSIGNLSAIREYKFIKGENDSYLNQVYKLNAEGDTIIEKSNFLKIEFLGGKEVLLSDTIRIQLELKAPALKSNKMFVFIDVSKEDFLRKYSENYSVGHIIIPSNAGTFTFSGFVDEFEYDKDSTVNSRRIYFSEKYTVSE